MHGAPSPLHPSPSPRRPRNPRRRPTHPPAPQVPHPQQSIKHAVLAAAAGTPGAPDFGGSLQAAARWLNTWQPLYPGLRVAAQRFRVQAAPKTQEELAELLPRMADVVEQVRAEARACALCCAVARAAHRKPRPSRPRPQFIEDKVPGGLSARAPELGSGSHSRWVRHSAGGCAIWAAGAMHVL